MADVKAAPTAAPPSARRLLRSTLIAAAVAVVLLFTVVLPAEYGVDPTGIGRLLGLTEMGRIKVGLAREAALADSVEAAARAATAVPTPDTSAAGVDPAPPGIAAAPAAPRAAVGRSDSIAIVLRPGEGKEIKLVMRKDARARYSWSTDRGVVNFDTHADAPGIRYHGYAKGTGRASDEGVLVAAFDGAHGWFWRNRSREVVTVTLLTSGDYQELKRVN